MKNCLPSIVSAALCLSLVMTPFVPVAAAYADDGSPAESSEIYVGDNYDENYDISLFERGRCTDSYSKAWCDSHGFANNRPRPSQGQAEREGGGLPARSPACWHR